MASYVLWTTHPVSHDGRQLTGDACQIDLRFKWGCSIKKSESTGFNIEESSVDLCSSGESDFFSTDISGCASKIIIQEINVAGNAQLVGKNNEFISIAEMPIDILLPGIRSIGGF